MRGFCRTISSSSLLLRNIQYRSALQKRMNPLGLEWNEEEFISVLDSVMQHVEFLQNNPPNLIPKEDLAADAIINFLKPYESVIKVTKYTYVPGRSNLVLEYPINCSENSKVISFVGSHFDVVPANPDEWDFNPFKLSREGDFLRGRGVTDCLGHVALIACLFRALAVSKPKLDIAVKAVFIASEENNEIPHVGIEEMELQGDLRKLSLQNGPLIWVDSANFGPTLGCAGTQTWQMKFLGKAFHSGLPHKAINPIDLASEVMRYRQL